MLHLLLFVLLGTAGAFNAAVAGGGAITSVLEPRQDSWWPYGPYSQWGIAGAPSSTSPPTPLTNVASTGPTASNPALSSIPALDVAPTSLLTTTDLSTAQSSTATTAPVATITALPPAATPSRRYKQFNSGRFNIAYLSPVFALAGAIVGALLAWIVIRLLRRKGLWESRLKAGPPYVPTETLRDESNTEDSASQATSEAFLDRRRASRRSTRDSKLSHAASKRSSNWLVRALSSHQREPAADSDAELGNQSGLAEHEDDPFLVPPSADRPSRGTSLANTRNGSPPRFELLRTPDALSEDEELDNAPWDTLRHKSIRRGILERLQEGPQHRKGHQRNDSDVTVEQAQYLSVPPLNIRSPARGRSLTRVRSDETDSSAPSSSGPGFRIVEEDYENGARSNILGIDIRLPWRSPSAKSRARDNLTALPARASSVDRRRSPVAASRIIEMLNSPQTPSRVRYPASPPPRLPRVDSNVLPSSPPRIASPPLEAQLFFAPLASFGSAPKLHLTAPATPRSSELPEKRHRNKLHTTRAPPPLPFPSSPEYAHSPTRLVSSPPSRPGTSAEQIERKHGALDRVGQILAQSYSLKDLKGEERVRSPTMFGAVV
ncbi:uncharacterized protein PHACADRAFT_263033 [Phanerochaete carnosa HHB-10118-sp]|uniref:Proteophosphoglycan ppg4 n=1 Tax=Phanerochaete carnosa (strain HHB-10118-sp) TaxID=650164 RepID=K5VIG0_PHACS|nr:uncharacterized protein PHACADRAFT_263033 [Phanerochaete carnosa HHB-10118-sp]EKM51063.1 hypothetical protein PHACADRAFT_263033 [Phanerochaete carnosa HHB-10118-sp]